MKLLIAGEVSSVHTARWMNQLKGTGWDIHVYQVMAPGYGIHPGFEVGRIHYPLKLPVACGASVQFTTPYTTDDLKRTPELLSAVQKEHLQHLRAFLLADEPDVIHSHGLNINWNNLLEPLKAVLDQVGPRCRAPWLYSTWGSDLDFYAASSDRVRAKVESALRMCDYLTSECQRDRRLAQEMGFSGEYCGFFPDFGGVDLEDMSGYRKQPPSRRKTIFLKGRDCSGPDGDPVGRAMTIMDALESCANTLNGYTVAVSQATKSVRDRADGLRRHGLDVRVLPHLPYDALLAQVADSRLAVSMTINDGLPSSLVEAMSLGAFPIYSDLAPMREWITHGENGFLVAADDVEGLEDCLTAAIRDDRLVDRADDMNRHLVRERLAYDHIRDRVIELYRHTAKSPSGEEGGFAPRRLSGPRFSIIVPTYNQADYLPAALDSILGQSYPHWEALVVNDGSTDRTAAAMEDYAARDSRIRLFHKENGGVASALNEGIRHAGGEWICWLSSDDLFEPDKLQIHLDAIRTHPDTKFFYSHFYYLDEKTGTKSEPDLWNPIPSPEFQVTRLLLGPYIHGNSIAIHRSVFEKVGLFDETLRTGQDFDMWLRISAVFQSRYIDRRTCTTRWHRAQTTNLFPEAGFFDSARACIRFLNSHSFSQVFPLLDLTTPADITKAIGESIGLSLHPNAIMNTCGFTPALLERLHEWFLEECPPSIRPAIQKSICRAADTALKSHPKPALSRALETLRQPLGEDFRYEPHDFVCEAASYANQLERSGEPQKAATLLKYLKTSERKSKVLFYYAGMHNSNQPFAGTNQVFVSLARELGKKSDAVSIDLTGDFVHGEEAIEGGRIIPLPRDGNKKPSTEGYDTVVFGSHLRSFQQRPKPSSQVWILHQHCWSIEPAELERIADFDHIIALNRRHREQLVSQGAPAENVLTIVNGIDMRQFRPTSDRRQPFSIMYSGALVPHKCVHILLQALPMIRKMVPEAGVHIYGSSAMWHMASDYEHLLKSTSTEGVIFHGSIPNHRMPAIYSRHDLLCLPSLLESFGLVTIEAQACGCIPVVHATGGTPETLQDGKTGFLYRPNAPHALAEAVIKAFDSLRRDPDMRNRAVQFARERFKISDVADRFSTIIRVAGDPKRQNRERRLAQLNAESLRLMERREYQAAMRQLQKALELDPVYPATHYNVGLLYLETGNPGIALDSFIKVLEQDPSDSDAVLKCGAILRANNLEGHARRLYSIYLRQHPNDRKVRQMAGHS